RPIFSLSCYNRDRPEIGPSRRRSQLSGSLRGFSEVICRTDGLDGCQAEKRGNAGNEIIDIRTADDPHRRRLADGLGNIIVSSRTTFVLESSEFLHDRSAELEADAHAHCLVVRNENCSIFFELVSYYFDGRAVWFQLTGLELYQDFLRNSDFVSQSRLTELDKSASGGTKRSG
ncbi:MAG: hypothetical protein NT113_01100, partial [Hyphomicrobiales bacterium]|nr:hypothetical protein [Hyphomicrobiales bacterium]